MTDVNDFLAHYGVKGMKWGVSKGLVSPGVQRTKKEEKIRTQRKDARRRRQTLSDKDLDKLVNRLQQEKKVKDLLDSDLSPGRTAVKKIVLSSTGVVAGVALAGGMKYGIKAALQRKFDIAEAASYVIPKPKK
jgi:hypothetical protein